MRAMIRSGLLLALSWAPVATATGQSDLPNVLLILGADHAVQSLGAYGSPLAATPHLDRLAAGGVVFTRAYANCPLDVPSRLSMLTGLYPHAIAVSRSTARLEDRFPTIADGLALVGRASYVLGASYLPTTLDRDLRAPIHGFFAPFDRQMLAEAQRRQGPSSIPPEVQVKPLAALFRHPTRLWLNADNQPMGLNEVDSESHRLAEEGVDWIRRLVGREQTPFFLVVGFEKPSAPFDFPADFRPDGRGPFRADEFAAPPFSPEDSAELPVVFRELTDEDKRGVIAAYYNEVAFLDRSIGILLDGLEREGVADRTLVIYAANNGYLLGEHGRFEKHSLHEPAVRVPLIMRWPGLLPAGVRRDALVELVDIAPTIAEAAGAPRTPRIAGRSLLALARGEVASVRPFVFSEYLETESATIRDERFKLIYSTGKGLDMFRAQHRWSERRVRLFDLVEDPGETRNLAGESEHAARVASLKRTLHDRFLEAEPGGVGLPEDVTIEERLDLFLVPREVWRELGWRWR